jgi:protein transport protein SEC24
MSAPTNDGYGGYPPATQQYAQQSPYPEQPQGYKATSSPPPSAAGAPAGDHGRKKKRAYAAQAFEVGQGGNAAAGGQLPGAGQFGTPQPLTPGYGGYPAQDPQVPAYGGAPPYGVPQPGAPIPGAVGYQAPEPYYPSAAPGAAAGVAGITSGLSGMQLGAGAAAQPAQPAPGQARPIALNQLYPTDLLNQPFNVSELDLPPPPIILPPNVSSPILLP